MTIATPGKHVFRRNSPWLIVIGAIVLIAGTVGIGSMAGLFHLSSRSGPPAEATTAQQQETVVAYQDNQISLVTIEGKVIKSVQSPELGSPLAAAGGDHALFVAHATNHLIELRSNGATFDLGPLLIHTYPGLQTTILSFMVSPDGSSWAWATDSEDFTQESFAGAPLVYGDVYVAGVQRSTTRVYHEVGDTFPVLYRWTGQGPVFYRHPYANLGLPFPPVYGDPILIDVKGGTTRSITGSTMGFRDLSADGTIAYSNGCGAVFESAGARTMVAFGDQCSVGGIDIYMRPGASATTAVVGIAREGSAVGTRWLYETQIVDVKSGALIGGPLPNVRPASRPWLMSGSVVLEGTSPNPGIYLYSSGQPLRKILSGYAQVLGLLNSEARVSSPSATAHPTEASPTPRPTPSPPVGPGPRAGATMVYDPLNHGIILFGGSYTVTTPDGHNDAVTMGDTWLWDGRSWRQLDVSGPPARAVAMATYDSVHQVIVLFGGSGPLGAGLGKLFQDTWTWDGNRWQELRPAHVPNPRARAAFAFDEAHSVAVMFGGEGEGTTTYDATWTWDGSDWTLQDPATVPAARHFASMAYDAAAGVTVLFGGSMGGSRFNDTWTWDGKNWTQASAAPPQASGWSSLVYNSAAKQIVAYVYFALQDHPVAEYTITWDGSRWTDRSTPKDPSPRAQAAIAYDPSLDRVVLYGGVFDKPQPFDEMWMWDGSAWSLWHPTIGSNTSA